MTTGGDWQYLDPRVKTCWLIKGLIGIFFFFFFVVIFPTIIAYSTGGYMNFYYLLFSFIIFFIILSILVSWIILFYNRYQFTLTDEAVLINQGILWKRSVTIPYERIQHVSINRGPIEQLLGIYAVNIFTAGTASFPYGGGPTGMMGQFAAEGYIPGVADGDGLRETVMRFVKATKSGSGLGDVDRIIQAQKATPATAATTEVTGDSEVLQELRKIRILLEKSEKL